MITITMNERTWTYRDKSNWGEGEWKSEPDRIQYTDPDTGYPCLIVRNQIGILCGYVGVSVGHSMFETQNNDDDYKCDNEVTKSLDVHGGITFRGFSDESDLLGICYISELWETDKIFWYGFDCAHAWDTIPLMHIFMSSWNKEGRTTYKNVAYVKAEIKSLATQLYALK